MIQVKLTYSKVKYSIHLGQLVSIWTAHLSTIDSTSSMTGISATYFTSIFPEQDSTCYFMTQDQSDDGTLCKSPQGLSKPRTLTALIRLSDLVQVGSEVCNVKVLGCVKSIGSKKRCT